MSIGRIEIVDGEKQFVPYADSGGGNNSASEYVYIEKLLKTETLLSEWNLAYDDADSKTTIYPRMYNVLTGEYIAKNSGGDNYIIEYVPLSFNVIPFYDIFGTIYPVKSTIITAGYFSYIGIDVDLTQGVFKFTNQRKLTENPIYTWFKNYIYKTGNVDDLKKSYPAMLFRGFLRKLEVNDPMYIKPGTKTLDDAESDMY